MPMPMYGGGGRKSNALLIIGLLCCCCIILPLIIYGSLWGTNTICDKTNPDDQPWLGMNCASVYEGSSTPAPATRAPATTSPTPSSTLPSGSITLLTTEITGDDTHQNIAAANTPTGLSATTPPSYTLSVQFYNTGDGGGWREFFSNQGGDTWNDTTNRPIPEQRNPILSVVPNDSANAANKNKVAFVQNLANGSDILVDTTSALSLNQWYTLTFTGTANKLTIYVNGVKNNEIAAPAGTTFVMANTNTFKWVPITYPGFTAIKLKNGYWWSRVLTDTEIAQIPNPSSTSTYMPQPLSMGTSAYVKDDFASY